MLRGDRHQSPSGPALLHVVEEWWSEVAATGWHGEDGGSQPHRADHDYGWFATGGPYRTWREAEQRWSELVAHTGQPTRFRIVSTGEARSAVAQREEPAQPSAATIYERLGGQSAVRQLVSEFYRRMTEDPVFAPRFRYVDMGRLMNHQVALFTLLTGGPNETKRDSTQIHSWLRAAHSQLRLTQGEFDRMAAHLAGALRDSGVSETDVQALIRSLEAYRADIVSS
jgi:hemoglobin